MCETGELFTLHRTWKREWGDVMRPDSCDTMFLCSFCCSGLYECPWIVASSGKTGLKREDRVCRFFFLQNDSVG